MVALVRCRGFGLALLTVCLAAGRGPAGDVQGYVKDAGKKMGDDGLDAVEVRLTPKQGAALKKRTDANGQYQFTAVPNGDCKLEFDRVGYSPRPREIPNQPVKDGQNQV